VDEIVEVGVPRAVAEAVQRKLNPQETEILLQVAEERVDYQTEGNHNEP
ncbi:excinuclease ABC subunit C, partial [Streptococcus pneumoniae]|nr:excinuclease ABC subunit C [Streptococcus pneumoniae]